MDDTFLSCLICNSLISVESKDSHVINSAHLNNYSKCKENKNNLKLQNAYVDSIKTPSNNIPAEGNSAEKLDAVEKSLKTDISPATFDATQKESDSVIEIDSNVENNNNLKIAHANSIKIKDNNITAKETTEEKVDIAKNCVDIETEKKNIDEDKDIILTPAEAYQRALTFAKENGLRYKRNGTYCKVCNVKISSSLKRLQEHVAEQLHKHKAAALLNVTLNKKITMDEFVVSETTLESVLYSHVVINDKYFLDELSYQMITANGRRLRCQTCEVSLDRDDKDQHIRSWKHVQGMQVVLVITDMHTEFLREVRPGVYHCGFCNFIEASWYGLQNHLKSINHCDKKTVARMRLERLQGTIEANRKKQNFLNFIRMLYGR